MNYPCTPQAPQCGAPHTVRCLNKSQLLVCFLLLSVFVLRLTNGEVVNGLEPLVCEL